jgi:hypothetical protein
MQPIISDTDRELFAWLEQCQREDAPWVYEEGPKELPRTPIRGKGGKPTGKFEPSGREGMQMLQALHGEKDMARTTTKRNEPPTEGKDMDLVRQQRESAAAILAPLDATATEMERKWGAGVLPTLVPAEWAEKFHSARLKLNAAIDKLDLIELANKAEIMRRGWIKLDELALAAGCVPGIPSDVWEVRSPSGRVYAVARRQVDELNYRPDGARLITLDEVARILDAWDQDGFITELRAQFPGSQIVKAGVIPPDDVPDVGADPAPAKGEWD